MPGSVASGVAWREPGAGAGPGRGYQPSGR